jgi:hypothetical protein
MARIKSSPIRSRDPTESILVLLSRDIQLEEAVKHAAGPRWTIVSRAFDELTSLIREPNVRVVVFDDESVSALDRGWALAEIRRCASRASILYVAGQHDPDIERQARVRGVLFYTSKPLMTSGVSLLLDRLRMHNRNNDLQIGQPRTTRGQS